MMHPGRKPAADPDTVKRVLIVKGKVQRVGYRGTVQDIAQEMGVGGTVRNLPDGTVQVVCTGTRETLDSSEGRISIRGALIQVSEVARAGESPVGSASRIFKVIPDSAALEAMEAGATGAKYLAIVASAVESTADGVKQLGAGVQDLNVGIQEVKEGFQETNRGLKGIKAGVQETNRELHEFNSGMQVRFDSLEERYGEIGPTARVISESMRQTHEELVRLRSDQEQPRARMAQLIENNNRAVGELTVAVRELRSNGRGTG